MFPTCMNQGRLTDHPYNLIIGCFDFAGHMNAFRQARALGQQLGSTVPAINSSHGCSDAFWIAVVPKLAKSREL